ncbi:uncharacterized protein LOC141666281 [Apium graveolens]|uniref:uncharacterized protein LOC141666281 n=1 Tax=Apium graveolens TaxID=4045 RepID=UPI003D7BD8C1
MELIGHQFTWERGRGKPEWMEVHLDRALMTQNWLNMFPIAKLYNLKGSISDHIPIFLIPQKDELSRGQRRFHFENAWLLEPMCKVLVDDCWKERDDVDIQTKVMSCSEKLVVWGKEVTGNFRGSPKESSTRRRTNRIHKLKDYDGEWKEWNGGLEEMITAFYNDLFSVSQVECQEVIDCMSTSISHAQNEFLLEEITYEDVKDALFQMHPDKAPGPDGMTPAFY